MSSSGASIVMHGRCPRPSAVMSRNYQNPRPASCAPSRPPPPPSPAEDGAGRYLGSPKSAMEYLHHGQQRVESDEGGDSRAAPRHPTHRSSPPRDRRRRSPGRCHCPWSRRRSPRFCASHVAAVFAADLVQGPRDLSERAASYRLHEHLERIAVRNHDVAQALQDLAAQPAAFRAWNSREPLELRLLFAPRSTARARCSPEQHRRSDCGTY